MNDEKPKVPVSAARKKLVAFIVVGILLIALAPTIPSLVARFHLGSSRFGSRMEWRILALGLVLVGAPVVVLIKFRHEKD